MTQTASVFDDLADFDFPQSIPYPCQQHSSTSRIVLLEKQTNKQTSEEIHMSSNDITDKHLSNGVASASPMASIGVPRAVSDDDMTEYPAVKRRRDNIISRVDHDRRMEVQPVPATLLSQDDILMEMIKQSGTRSYADIVSFCVESGIPLSRMFRLDLMRQAQH